MHRSVNLESDILDAPEFFWDNADLESLYAMARKACDLHKRTDILNKRLDVLKELFEMLSNELNNQHSSNLEWIVIGLIVIEVILEIGWNIIVKDILGLYQWNNGTRIR